MTALIPRGHHIVPHEYDGFTYTIMFVDCALLYKKRTSSWSYEVLSIISIVKKVDEGNNKQEQANTAYNSVKGKVRTDKFI